MTENTKETAAQKRMREFREAQARLAANRQRAKGGDKWPEPMDSSRSRIG